MVHKGVYMYTMDEVVEMIENAKILIPLEEFFKDGEHITKKEYGHLVIKYLIEELKDVDRRSSKEFKS